ncbi:fumarylacetoacetate hydrolase family protein [Streptomyces spinosisporus]|uniref:Fumarylacetoacetate hydrolase family protein n=1 Tax=Streptomyces spinosisporus TaxID=2927582 RepID=A0ABS9XA34_9ACTN|nr:fumarylacetoacetate hydrolase family protein [Streptomyces spinosisporus]MCI3238918.1 fumarylacetoacetate hydrolase family protein [Streptomyces spinosisporus]
MKIASRRTPLGDRLCFADVIPHQLIDLQAAYVRRLESKGVHRDDALARSARALSGDLRTLLRAEPTLDTARRLHDWAVAHSDTGVLDEECLWDDRPRLLGSPVGTPTTVWCMLANYPRGPRASGEAPPRPRGMQGCLKAPSAIVGPHDDLRHPAISQSVDPEMELAVVIGRRCRFLDTGNAMTAVAGYLGFCDVGSRDVSDLDNGRMDRGKGFDSYGITGPWFVSADEVPDPHDLYIRQWVNGSVRQDGSTSDMYRSIPEQLTWLTAALTLSPGDLLSTGTPAGHGTVKPKDVVRGEVQGLGVIENTVVPDD